MLPELTSMTRLVTITRRFRNTDEFAPRQPFPVALAVIGIFGTLDVISVAATLIATF